MSSIRKRGYNWYPNPPDICPYIDINKQEEWVDGWLEAERDSKSAEDSERQEYEEMKAMMDRWGYLMDKYGEED